jgi:hypothetical protein
VSRAVAPPSGSPAPQTATLAGRSLALHRLHCLHWAVLDVEGSADVEREVAWLASILSARGFPLERLARNLELAADVVAEGVAAPGAAVADRLRAAAAGLP